MAGSVTGWVESLKRGDVEAAEKIWDRLFKRLCRRISPSTQMLRMYDDEDIAICAFTEFFQAVRDGRFKNLADRNELWSLLATIAVRKSFDCQKYETAARRGGGLVRHRFEDLQIESNLSVFTTTDSAGQAFDVLSEIEQSLDDEGLCEVLRLKVQGLENKEIALQIGCSLRTVQYMVRELTVKILSYKD